MIRSISIYGVVLALLLGASWVEWTSEPEPDVGDKVLLVQGDLQDLEKVTFKGEKDEAVVERKRDDHGEYIWVTYTKWEEVKPPKAEPATPEGPTPAEESAPAEAAPADPNAPAESAPAESAPAEAAPPERVAKVQGFKGGEAGEKMLESMSPLLALRKLDAVPADKLPTLGLDAPKESLEITRKGRTRKLELGGEAYGSKDRYVRDLESGEIYLVDDDVLKPLKFARTRLPDRALWSISRDKLLNVTVSAEGQSADFLQQNAEDEKAANWVRAEAPTEPAEQVQTWMSKALQLKGSSFVNADEQPDDLQPRFTLTMKGSDGTVEHVEVTQQGDAGDWFARSEHTRGLVKLLKGPTSALGEDVVDLIGG